LVDQAAELRLERVVVAASTTEGVQSIGSTLDVMESVVRDTRSQPGTGWYGHAITAHCDFNSGTCGSLSVARSLIAGNRNIGLFVDGTDATITASVVRDTLPQESDQLRGRGINAQCSPVLGICGSLAVTGCLVVGNHASGIFTAGADVTVTSTVVRDTLPRQTDLDFGRGIQAECHPDLGICGHLRVTSSLIAGNRDVGIVAEGAAATIASSVVRDTLPRESDHGSGRGIGVQCDSDLSICGLFELSSSVVVGNREIGVTTGGVEATITSSVVRDTLPQQSDQMMGYGISGECHPYLARCSRLTVIDSLIAGNRVVGVYASGADAQVVSSVVRDTQPQQSDQFGGMGIVAGCSADLGACGRLAVTGSLIAGNRDLGIFSFGIETTVTGSVVRDTLPRLSDNGFGRGCQAQCLRELETCGSLTATNSLIASNVNSGILAYGVPIFLQSVAVTDTRAIPEGDNAGDFGQGIWAGCDDMLWICPPLEMTHCLVAGSHTAGVAALGASGFIQGSVIHQVAPRPLDSAYGYGLQVEGLAGAPGVVMDVRETQVMDATLAGILYYQAGGTISGSVVSGADFAVVYAGGTGPPTDAGDNVLDGDVVSGLSRQELEPSPAPPPVFVIDQ
jgi:hypothetical protein